MLPSESYPSPSSSSLSILSYSVRSENAFRSTLIGVEIETPPPSSFLPSADLFENYLHYMMYSYLLFSVKFRKKISTFCFPIPYSPLYAYLQTSLKITLLCCVLILLLLFRICQKIALNFCALILTLLYRIC